MVVDICTALSSCPMRLLQRRRPWAGGGNDATATEDRLAVTSLSGPAGTFTSLTAPDFPVSTVKVEVHSSNSSSGAGSDENLSSSSSDRGSDPGTAAGENDYEDIYEVRQRAGGVGVGHHMHNRGKESKSPSRDSGSHSRSGSMSSTGSGGIGSGMGVVSSGSSVVVLHTSCAGGTLVNSSSAAITNVTIGSSTTTCTMVTDSSNLIECYEQVGTITPGTSQQYSNIIYCDNFSIKCLSL